MNKRKKGFEEEEKAVNFLVNLGYEIIQTNFYSRFGEIDIIAKKNVDIIFIEVKYRKSNLFGEPEESVNIKKMKKICKTALFYINSKNIYDNSNFRFDVISITGNEIKHIISAFDYIL